MKIIGKYLIYGLVDPRDGQLRYVGKSAAGLDRPRRKHAAHCRCWEKNLENEGLEKKIIVVQDLGDDCPLHFLGEAEIFWIAYFKKMGCSLTNMTEGGDGISNMSSEIREKISRAKKGKPSNRKNQRHSIEARTKMRDAHLGKKLSTEHRKNISRARKGLPSGMKGKSHSAVSRLKMSLAQKRKNIERPMSEDIRKKISCALSCPVRRCNDGVIFSSVGEAARASHVSWSGIGRVLRGKRSDCKGLRFEYVDIGAL